MEKREYVSPEIEVIRFDSDISLHLESSPMQGPFESLSEAKQSNSFNPFNMDNFG